MKVWPHLDNYFWVKYPKTLYNNNFLQKICILAVFDDGKHGGLNESNFSCINKENCGFHGNRVMEN